MRGIAEIERELAELQKKLAEVEGTPTEVYSRIVGYYRSVRNWNKGKREEYGERKLFDLRSPSNPSTGTASIRAAQKPLSITTSVSESPVSKGPLVSHTVEKRGAGEISSAQGRLILFVRRACPNCPAAKAAAEKLAVPLSLIDADTEPGLEEARRWNVWGTPTAILLSAEGQELSRAQDAPSILAFKALLEGRALSELKNNASGLSTAGATKISTLPSAQDLDAEPVSVAI